MASNEADLTPIGPKPKVVVKVVQMNFSCKRTLNFQGVNYEETIEVEFEGTPEQQRAMYERVRLQLAERVTDFAESQVRRFGGDM